MDKLGNIPKVADKMKEEIQRHVFLLEVRTAELAPVRRRGTKGISGGRLRNSYQTAKRRQWNRITWRMSSKVDYAIYQEFGPQGGRRNWRFKKHLRPAIRQIIHNRLWARLWNLVKSS